MGENFAYCISNYLGNRYDNAYSEELVFVLGSCHNLSFLSQNTGHVVQVSKDVMTANSGYISGTSKLALQNFATVINSVLRVEQRNGVRDLKWIVNDYHDLNHIKTLTTFPSTILNEGKTTNPQLIYTLAYPIGEPKSSQSEAQIEKSKIALELYDNCSFNLTGAEFLDYWQDNSYPYTLTTNRFVIIPPTFHDFTSSLKMLIKNALLRTYLNLEGSNIGPNLVLNLIQDLDRNESLENVNLHRKLLVNSIDANDMSGQNDMGRNYAAKCFESLGKNLKMEDIEKSSTFFKKAGFIWKKAYSELSLNSNVSKNLLKEIYLELYSAEKNIINQFKFLLRL